MSFNRSTSLTQFLCADETKFLKLIYSCFHHCTSSVYCSITINHQRPAIKSQFICRNIKPTRLAFGHSAKFYECERENCCETWQFRITFCFASGTDLFVYDNLTMEHSFVLSLSTAKLLDIYFHDISLLSAYGREWRNSPKFSTLGEGSRKRNSITQMENMCERFEI